jgi:UPF0755 protein
MRGSIFIPGRKTVFIGTAILIFLLVWGGSAMYSPHSRETQHAVDIPRGTSVRAIAGILADHDIISNRYIFILAAKLSDKGDRLQSGLYLFPNHVSTVDVLTILSEGSHQAYRNVTIREGLTIRQIATQLEQSAGFAADSVLALTSDRTFIEELGLSHGSLEGYLFPETYRVRHDETLRALLARMVRENDAVFDAAADERMRVLRRSRHEIVTMASLVEGETRLPGERARVAGVYYNRLRRGMLLQADPTVQYVIPDGPRRLYYRDLSINSPYNTYMYAGLPPGPVNNPGKAAILAAMSPEQHDFLYFVADGQGGHTFSRTLDEHNRAVAAYRKTQRR